MANSEWFTNCLSALRGGGTRDLAIDNLWSELDGLPTGEIETLVEVAKRLKVGLADYGPLNLAEDPRDWDEELRQELLDAMVYRAFRVLAAGKRRRTLSRHPLESTDLDEGEKGAAE